MGFSRSIFTVFTCRNRNIIELLVLIKSQRVLESYISMCVYVVCVCVCVLCVAVCVAVCVYLLYNVCVCVCVCVCIYL
jgi:hypothetical protein